MTRRHYESPALTVELRSRSRARSDSSCRGTNFNLRLWERQGGSPENAIIVKTAGQKLFLKAGKTLRVISPPENLADLIGKHDATVLPERSGPPADVVLLFVLNRAELEARLQKAKSRTSPTGALWLAYPKGTSHLKGDINRDTIREYAQALGLDTVSIVAFDDNWSCLRMKIVG
jgi:hypothetical protein